MKTMIAVVSLSLIPLIVQAESPVLSQSIPVAPATAAVSPVSEENGSSTWRTLITGVGVVGGVLMADLIMGGSLTTSLFGWGTSTTVGPVVYSPEVLNARAAGAVLGEMITPATNIRDVAARQDMFYTLMLGVGGAVGAVLSYGLAANSTEHDMGVASTTTK